jgi:hypothetical protein
MLKKVEILLCLLYLLCFAFTLEKKTRDLLVLYYNSDGDSFIICLHALILSFFQLVCKQKKSRGRHSPLLLILISSYMYIWTATSISKMALLTGGEGQTDKRERHHQPTTII